MNSWQSSAVSGMALCAALALAGCGSSDGSRELAAGRAAYEAGDMAKAEKQLLKAEKIAGPTVEGSVLMALVDLKKGELPAAREQIKRAEAVSPNDLDVRIAGAQIAWHLKDYAKAEKLYRAISADEKLSPAERSRGWTGLGIVMMTKEAYDLARVDFLQALRLDRRNASAHYHLGHLYRNAPFSYAEAALEEFEVYVRLDLTDPVRVERTRNGIIRELRESIAQESAVRPGVATRDSAASEADIAKAEKAFERKAYKQALGDYRNALKADPLAYPAALGVARSILKTETTSAGQREALKSYRLACALHPGAIATFLEAGALAEKMGQTLTAREIYSHAVAANPSSVSALDGLIRALQKSGDRKVASAYQQYRAALTRTVRR